MEIVAKLLTLHLVLLLQLMRKVSSEAANLGINGICTGDVIQLNMTVTAGVKMQYNSVDYFNPAITTGGTTLTNQLVAADTTYKLLAQMLVI